MTDTELQVRAAVADLCRAMRASCPTEADAIARVFAEFLQVDASCVTYDTHRRTLRIKVPGRPECITTRVGYTWGDP